MATKSGYGTWDKPYIKPTTLTMEILERASPFRNGEVEAQGAKEIFEHPNPLLGYVYDRAENEYVIALGCEHWAPNGHCRYGKECDEWQVAKAMQGSES